MQSPPEKTASDGAASCEERDNLIHFAATPMPAHYCSSKNKGRDMDEFDILCERISIYRSLAYVEQDEKAKQSLKDKIKRLEKKREKIMNKFCPALGEE